MKNIPLSLVGQFHGKSAPREAKECDEESRFKHELRVISLRLFISDAKGLSKADVHAEEGRGEGYERKRGSERERDDVAKGEID